MERENGIAARIKQCIGDEPVAAFSRRCGIGESLMRKYLAGSEPSARNLARIADAAGVTLDWLATGRGPKRRELQPIGNVEEPSVKYAGRWEKIIALVEGIEDEAARAAAIEELFARAQSAAEMAELRQAVKDLKAAQQKRA
jgi:transcriptional regulator with XRE-family HTH domain